MTNLLKDVPVFFDHTFDPISLTLTRNQYFANYTADQRGLVLIVVASLKDLLTKKEQLTAIGVVSQ